jgi:hypothetical protein
MGVTVRISPSLMNGFMLCPRALNLMAEPCARMSSVSSAKSMGVRFSVSLG